MRKLLILLFFASVSVLPASPAVASTDHMVVTIGDRASVASDGTVFVPVTVTCFFHSATTQTSGVVTINVSQELGSGQATATGRHEPVVCDGMSRTYTVPATSSSQPVRPGSVSVSATGSATGTFEQQVCFENAAGEKQCQVWHGTETLQGSDGPDALLATGTR